LFSQALMLFENHRLKSVPLKSCDGNINQSLLLSKSPALAPTWQIDLPDMALVRFFAPNHH